MNKLGVGTLVPSNAMTKNGTEVPTPREEMKGVGVLTPLERIIDGTEVATPRVKSNNNGTKVPAPKRFLPHIDLIGYYQFVTFRTYDSLDSFIKKIRSENISNRKQEYKIDQYMDTSLKGCYLNDEVLSYLYSYFIDKDKSFYDLIAFSIMPNHIHILFKQNIKLPKIMKQIKGATAFEINKLLQRRGKFWEENYYDKVIRDEKHFEQVYEYIKYNAIKAELEDAKERFYGIYE